MTKEEQRLDRLATEAHDEAIKLYGELLRELRVRATQTGGPVDVDKQIPDSDERKIKLFELREFEKGYLEKLIELQNENLDYRYRLARLLYRQGENEKAKSAMNSIAGLDKPGYAKAHLVLANQLIRQPAISLQEQRENETNALVHLGHCLKKDKDNLEATELKAQLLVKTNRLDEAYKTYESLFKIDPIYYVPMLSINTQLKRPNRNTKILEKATGAFRQKIDQQLDDVDAWVTSWQHYTNCLVQSKDFETAEKSLQTEIEKQKTELANRRFLEKLLARVYTVWASATSGRSATAEQQAKQLELLSKAKKLDSRNAETLRWLAILGNSEHKKIAEQAKEIYDSRNDPDPPGIVLTEDGAHELAAKNYDDAIKHFEGARKQSPRDPRVLNNLAYAYLKSNNPNPERALLLVDQAIAFLPQLPSETKVIQSHFAHTRAEALKQLGRTNDAFIGFEAALEGRPNNEDILSELFRLAAEKDDTNKVEVYKARLEKVRQANKKK